MRKLQSFCGIKLIDYFKNEDDFSYFILTKKADSYLWCVIKNDGSLKKVVFRIGSYS